MKAVQRHTIHRGQIRLQKRQAMKRATRFLFFRQRSFSSPEGEQLEQSVERGSDAIEEPSHEARQSRVLGAVFLLGAGASVVAWRVREDWNRIPEIDLVNSSPSAQRVAILKLRPELEAVLGTHKQKDRARKLSEFQNLYEILSKGTNEDAFDCCINLLSYEGTESQIGGFFEDDRLFLVLPYLFLTRAHEERVFHSGSRESEAASHYGSYSRDLCLSYFLRNGHILTYVQYLAKQQLFEILLFGGFTFALKNTPSMIRKYKKMMD